MSRVCLIDVLRSNFMSNYYKYSIWLLNVPLQRYSHDNYGKNYTCEVENWQHPCLNKKQTSSTDIQNIWAPSDMSI